MFRLIAVTLAGLFVVFQIYGSEENRPIEVSREATSEALGFSFADFIQIEEDAALQASSSGLSEATAIELAVAAGVDHRANRSAAPLRGGEGGQLATRVVTDNPVLEMWYVTGSQVNLRSGPGTRNAVIATVSFGREAELLDSRNGWHQIKTVDGTTSGWIFGKFLADQLPG